MSMSQSISVADLERRLEDARKRLELGVSIAAYDSLLEAERALAAAMNEPHAVPVEFPVQWDVGAPLPYLLRNEYKTFLVFFMRDSDPEWDGTYVNVRRANDPGPSKLAIVEFRRCVCAKLGAPDGDELIGHPLNGKGLRGYSPLRVENSSWVEELEAISSRDDRYRRESWRNLNHYLFGFRDSTFECIAESFLVNARTATVPELLGEVCGRLLR